MVLWQGGYDVIVISLLGIASANFHHGLWQSDHYFLIAFHSNFLSGMHGFRDNDVLLPTGYDVIALFPLGSVSHRFCWRFRLRFRHENSLQAPLAEKSLWRHIMLAIKPHYLKNHASQIKSYYWALSGSHSRSIRIRHEYSPQAPLGEEIMISSYPACNKTLLSRKPCI